MQSLCRYVIEEACEVVDAVESGERASIVEELGDLSLQVVFLAELGRRQLGFGPDDVVRGVVEKLERRHPHVFAEGVAQSVEEVDAAWDRLKAEEKKARPILDDIPRSLPALDGARRISDRVATVGFDWPDIGGSRAKVDEEFAELEGAVQAGDASAMEHELGDVFFALVNYARHLGIDPERALRGTALRFRRRFEHVEQEVRRTRGDWPRDDRGRPTRGVSLEELDSYWNDAKRLES